MSILTIRRCSEALITDEQVELQEGIAGMEEVRHAETTSGRVG
jgi:hypothetical protein